jgi:hypothetical protein
MINATAFIQMVCSLPSKVNILDTLKVYLVSYCHFVVLSE